MIKIEKLIERCQFMIHEAIIKHGDDYCVDGMKDEIVDWLSDVVDKPEEIDEVMAELEF